MRKRRSHHLMGWFSPPRWAVWRYITVSPVHHPFVLGLKPSYRYFYSGPTFVITELDGVRVMGPDVCDFVQKVPGTYHGR